ncbi:MAG: hypothetical protein JXR37_08530 [Kiritimatiellae bacterium]|nr:hypothetical protein [Kiritimatiellia bacterium]
MQEKIVLIGAGSAVFTRGIVADLIRRGEPIELALVDTDPHALEVVARLCTKMIEATRAPLELSASTDRRDALPGATAVVCTISVGGRRAWEQDVRIPRQYGIRQPVGDSVMPGGTSRALRMIPPMVAIAEDVLDLAPAALFFNYGNPMAAVCRGVHKATGAKMVGLCHGVVGVGRYLARVLDVPRERFRYTAIGMNHLTWFTEARVDGEDAMPRLHEIAAEKLAGIRYDTLGAKREEDGTVRPGEELDQPFCWQLFELFGAFPAVHDSHVMEFFPQFFASGQYFGKVVGENTRCIEKTIARGDKVFRQMEQDALSPDPLPANYFDSITGEHEQVVEIIESIRTDAGRIYSANLPNAGQVPNLPIGAVLEANAIADGGGIRHIAQPPLPAGVVGTLATRLAWVDTVVEAALEGSRDKFIQALVLDGSVRSLAQATALADELLAAHAQHLPRFARAGAMPDQPAEQEAPALVSV